jgi:hypothetical protein
MEMAKEEGHSSFKVHQYPKEFQHNLWGMKVKNYLVVGTGLH